MIAAPFRPLTELRLLDAGDDPWIGRVIDVVEASRGEPWRVLLDRLEHAADSRGGGAIGAGPAQVAAIVGALRRVTDRRAAHGGLARAVRGRVLGAPALDRDERDGRIAATAAALRITPADVEALLWADLALERPVALPDGRPAAPALAALANLDRIQRAVRRAHELELRIWEHGDQLARACARDGLLAQVSRAPDGATVLEIAGPLSLSHDAAPYGRALAALVPRLAAHARFRLELRTRVGDGAREHTILVEPPVRLPPPPPRPRRRTGPIEHLAAELAAAGCALEHEPAPIPSGDQLLLPDLAIAAGAGRAPAWIELVGSPTDEHLARKLARYEAAAAAAGAPPQARRRIVLCVDAARCPRVARGGHASAPAILPFRRRIDAAALLARLAPP